MQPSTTDILEIGRCGDVCVVTILARELNSATAEELSTRLLAMLNDGTAARRFVLDFEQVHYMESACFGALVTFVKWLSRCDGRIAIANVTENVRFLFAVTNLDKVFSICPNVPAALAAVEN